MADKSKRTGGENAAEGIQADVMLEAGAQLGDFEITGTLGFGGMGEVYRANDTRLGREVAIKTLPAALADDKERLARFEREAKLLASLNHAHIASVYSLNEHGGTTYIAMELVEGTTLEKMLERGALPVDEALRIALQIALALEAAHAKGVVHRDLKPANIMLTPDGVVKVLDFGLAKAFAGDPNESSALHSPALSVAMTQAGLALGTAGYMSPEQASGQATDQRADVWGIGVVLYEMLTGHTLFGGESVPHILADVLKTEPDWSRLPQKLNPQVRPLLERCLEKRPRNRYHAIADVRIEIEKTIGDPEGRADAVVAVATPGARLGRGLGLAAAGALVAALVAWALWPEPELAEPSPVVRFSLPLPDDPWAPPNASFQMLSISRDGARIAYVAENLIWLRNLAEATARPLTDPANGQDFVSSPTFSPDGQWVAYVLGTGNIGPYAIMRVPIDGGVPRPIHEADGIRDMPIGLSWPTSDALIFTDSRGIVRIPASGGAAEVLVAREEGERFQSPQILAGGNAVLFTRVPREPGTQGGFDESQIVVQSIGADDRTVIWEGGLSPRYLASGHVVFAQGSTLYAAPFDPESPVPLAGAARLMEGMRRSVLDFTDTANFAIADTGTLVSIPGGDEVVVVAGNTPPDTIPVWVDREGREEPLALRADQVPDAYSHARISPDGSKIAFVIGRLFIGVATTRPPELWIYDRATANLRLLTADPNGEDSPVWSADSSHIYFRSLRESSPGGIFEIDIETGETNLIAPVGDDITFPIPWSLSPADDTLTIVTSRSATDMNIATLTPETGEFSMLRDEEALRLTEPVLSPQGGWMAYEAMDVTTSTEINLAPFPGIDRTRYRVGFGNYPVFSPDGSELFFRDDRGLAVAAIAYEPTVATGEPRLLFEDDRYLWQSTGRAWDIDVDGERFLMLKRAGSVSRTSGPADAPGDTAAANPVRIDVVINWLEELKDLVPIEGESN